MTAHKARRCRSRRRRMCICVCALYVRDSGGGWRVVLADKRNDFLVTENDKYWRRITEGVREGGGENVKEREIENLQKKKIKTHCLGFKMYCGESKREFRWVYIYGLCVRWY